MPTHKSWIGIISDWLIFDWLIKWQPMNDRYDKNRSKNDLCPTGKKGPSSKPTDHLDGLGRFLFWWMSHRRTEWVIILKMKCALIKLRAFFFNRKEWLWMIDRVGIEVIGYDESYLRWWVILSMKERHLLVFTHEMNVADGTLGLENHDGSVKNRSKYIGPKIWTENLDRIFSSKPWLEPVWTGMHRNLNFYFYKWWNFGQKSNARLKIAWRHCEWRLTSRWRHRVGHRFCTEE